jgi:hypothetical protein
MSKFLMSNHQQKSRDLIRLDYQRQRNGGIANTKNPYAMPGTLDVWMTRFDKLFAKTVFGNLDKEEIAMLAPTYPILTPLCQDCSSTETGVFSRSSFVVSYEQAQASQTTCSLCAVLYKQMDSMTGDNKNKMVLQEGSSLTTARGEPPILSLIVGPSPGRLCISSLETNINRGRRSESFPGYLPERFPHSTNPWKSHPNQVIKEMDQVV